MKKGLVETRASPSAILRRDPGAHNGVPVRRICKLRPECVNVMHIPPHPHRVSSRRMQREMRRVDARCECLVSRHRQFLRPRGETDRERRRDAKLRTDYRKSVTSRVVKGTRCVTSRGDVLESRALWREILRGCIATARGNYGISLKKFAILADIHERSACG